MKVYVINGSPRADRSNTYRLTQAFLRGLGEETELRESTVCRMDIRPCLGCFVCWSKTPGSCCLKDDMASVIENLLWADTVVWSFPLYYFSVPGGLKNLIDRQLPMVLPFMNAEASSGGHPARYDMSKKRHVVISTCGFYTAEGNYDGVLNLFDHLCPGQYTTLFCGQGELFRVKELSGRTGEYLGYAEQAGREFRKGSISRETRKKLDTLLFPRHQFEAMADASWGVEKSGEKSDEALVFTRQMAALYNPGAWPGKDVVLEMRYTDIGKAYQLLLGREGQQVLTENFKSPTTVIETPYSVWLSIAQGEISGEQAMMEGKYRVTGDFSLMIQWDRVFGGETAPEKPEKGSAGKTSMLNLMCWGALWGLCDLHPLYGPLGVIAVCALLGLALFKTRKTVYDVLSSAAVTLLACGALAGLGQETVTILSFFCFGAMWTVSCFFPVPLSAHYSVNDYGQAMAENRLFLKTNRIICAGWGILYLMIPVSMLVFGGTGLSWFSGLLLSGGSAAMGVFTLWFQRWYPAKVARGK